MREKLGADTSRVLPMLAQHDFTFLIEDPATIWNLGPQRYPADRGALRAADAGAGQAGDRHQHRRALPGRVSHQAANRRGIVGAGPPRRRTRFREWRCTSKLLSRAAICRLLASAAAAVDRAEHVNGKLVVESRRGVGVSLEGSGAVDGKPWPSPATDVVWLTARRARD